jgi:hypothetical protein
MVLLRKRENETGYWRKLHNEEFYGLYTLPNIILVIKSRMRWAGYVVCVGKKNAYRVLVGKPEGGRSLAGPRHKWEDSIKMDFKETEWEAVD